MPSLAATSSASCVVFHVSVLDRGWTTVESVVPDLLPFGDFPVEGALGGENVDINGLSTVRWSGTVPNFTTITDGGPNQGYLYIASSTLSMQRMYRINDYYSPAGGITKLLINGIFYSNWNALQTFTNDDPAIIYNGVLAHETYGQGTGRGHQGELRSAMQGFSCGDVNGIIERLAGSGTSVGTVLLFAINWGLGYNSIALDDVKPHTRVGNNHPPAPFAFSVDGNGNIEVGDIHEPATSGVTSIGPHRTVLSTSEDHRAFFCEVCVVRSCRFNEHSVGRPRAG